MTILSPIAGKIMKQSLAISVDSFVSIHNVRISEFLVHRIEETGDKRYLYCLKTIAFP